MAGSQRKPKPTPRPRPKRTPKANAGRVSAPEGAAVPPHRGSSLISASVPQIASAAHPCAARPPVRQNDVLGCIGFVASSFRCPGVMALHEGSRLRWRGVRAFPDRSHDLEDRRGRRTPGPWTKWHMDVPRPFVKTGCRPEGWAMAPGHGGPVRSRCACGCAWVCSCSCSSSCSRCHLPACLPVRGNRAVVLTTATHLIP